MTHWIRQYGGSLLIIVLAFAYLTRIYNLHVPEKYMFDEVYHAVTAKLIARNDPRAFEWWNPPPEADTAVDWLHPPLAKYFQALSIQAFGENSFGWRFSSVVFGVLVIVATYHLTMSAFNNHAQAVAAAALASLDGLLLVQSRIAMNDIFVTFFILLTLILYARYKNEPSPRKLLSVGAVSGLAIASKWSGLFILVTIILLESLRLIELGLQTKWKLFKLPNLQETLKKGGIYFVALVIIPASIYLASYWQMFAQGKDLQHFKELHNQIWYYQTHLEATHPYQSRPWQWALNLRPVWYDVTYHEKSRADVYAFGNPALFWGGLIALGYSAVIIVRQLAIKSKSKKKHSFQLLQKLSFLNNSPLFLVLMSYCLVWLPWQLSPRIMFFYHYTPAVPLLCIVLAYWLRALYKKKSFYRQIAVTTWAAIVVCFVVWYPHWIGIPMSNEIKASTYFLVPSWK